MDVFEEAADRIDQLARGERPDGREDPGVLAEFGLDAWASNDGLDEGPRHRSAHLRAAGRMSRIFRLPAPDAPGLAFVGGTAAPAAYGLDPGLFPPANVAGRGAAAEAAFLGCVGEAIEHLSRLEWGDEPLERRGSKAPIGLRPATAAALTASLPDGEAAEWLPALRLGDGRASAVPADLCLTRRRAGPRPPPSSGCAAGESWDDACLAAVLELVERDAAAAWWCGGRPARPLAAETLIFGLGPVLEKVRLGATGRRTWLLDITTDLDVSAVAAVSVDPDGFGLACGLAARTSLGEAARAAFLEVCQMELANRIVALKLAHDGPGALAPVEMRHRRRMETVDAGRSAILAATGAPRPDQDGPAPDDARGQLAWAVERLERHGVECLAVDLTRPALGVPAVRVIAPRLQGLPIVVRTERLVSALSLNADRVSYILDVDLI